MMAATSKAHVKTPVELSGEEEDHESSDQSESDGDADEGSVDGENDMNDMDDDDDDDDDEEEDVEEEADDDDADDKEDIKVSDGDEADDEDKGIEEVDGEPTNPNAGWADAMAKILQKKTPASKPTILVKSKELDKMKVKEKQEKLEIREKTDKKRTWEMMFRVKPDIATDREAERTFQRTATRGVVQLFNAVRKHQNLVNDKVKEVGGSDRKKAKLLSSVTKKDFIDVLRGKDTVKVVKAEKETAAAEKPSWSVLRDDFMMGAKMKDWDKQSDGEEEQPKSEEGAEDSDSD
ncbi:unnamed protein product [Gadus morhua 'NCC']